MISQLIKCRLVCNSCKVEIEFERDMWSNELPDGWEIWIETPKLKSEIILDGYVVGGVIPFSVSDWNRNFSIKCDNEDEFSNRRYEKHLCPKCKNIRDIIE